MPTLKKRWNHYCTASVYTPTRMMCVCGGWAIHGNERMDSGKYTWLWFSHNCKMREVILASPPSTLHVSSTEWGTEWNIRTPSFQKPVNNALWQRFNWATEGTAWARYQFAVLCLFALQSLPTVDNWLIGELIRRYIPSWIKHVIYTVSLRV